VGGDKGEGIKDFYPLPLSLPTLAYGSGGGNKNLLEEINL